MKEEYYRWYSPYLHLPIEMLVFGHQGQPLILFPPDDGRFFTSKDFQLIEIFRPAVEAGILKVYCPDPFNEYHLLNTALTAEQKLHNYLNYERLLVKEIFHKARLDTHKPMVALVGISEGGLHAANFGLKYPHEVSHIFCIDSIYDLRHYLGHDLFSGTAYFNSPVDFMGGMKESKELATIRQQQIILGVHNESERAWQGHNFSRVLGQNQINHQVIANHDKPVWEDWAATLKEGLHKISF